MDLNQLAQLLQQRELIIADREHYNQDPEEHLKRLIVASQALESWEKSHQSSLPPVLAHYLQRRSYSKALEFCQGLTDHH